MKFNVIDVGSCNDMPKWWKSEYIDNILTIDPMDKKGIQSKSLFTGKRFHHPIAIFDSEGMKNFYICNKKELSSLYEPDINFLSKTIYRNSISIKWNVIKIIKVKCVRLDSILNIIDIPFDFIKIDVQGAGLNVLKSSGMFLNNFKGIQIESEIVPLYKEEPLADEVDEFLKKNNFYLFKKLLSKKSIKKTVWNDFVYINRNATKKEVNFIRRIYR